MTETEFDVQLEQDMRMVSISKGEISRETENIFVDILLSKTKPILTFSIQPLKPIFRR